jgi:beta-barrel assembly-enhancing protease
MKNLAVQGLIIVVLFFATWFILHQVNWLTLFNVEKNTDKTEEKLGDLFWGMFQKTEKENKTPLVQNTLDSLVDKICTSNAIDRKSIKVHILDKDEINAFALPNGHLVVYTGLITAAASQEELSGVLCHEIAHIQLNHVMKKLITEVGLSVLISMTTGSGGGEMIKETIKMLSSSAFDRNLEKQADITAVDYLVKAKINPEPFADFLYMMSSKENETDKYFAWVSTHPASKERAEYVIAYSKDKKTIYEPAIPTASWDTLKETLGE